MNRGASCNMAAMRVRRSVELSCGCIAVGFSLDELGIIGLRELYQDRSVDTVRRVNSYTNRL